MEGGIRSADAVVLGSGAASLEQEADAHTLAAVLQVQDAVLACRRRGAPHLVAPIRRYATSKLASQYLDVLAAEAATSGGGAASGSSAVANGSEPGSLLTDPEFLVPQDVTSALMTQVVSDPSYAGIVSSLLFSSAGNEVYLRNPASFNIPCGVPISFAEVEEAVRLTRQTALGFIRGAGGGPQPLKGLKAGGGAAGARARAAAARSVVLGPPGSHSVTFADGDRIVVLAQDFSM